MNEFELINKYFFKLSKKSIGSLKLNVLAIFNLGGFWSFVILGSAFFTVFLGSVFFDCFIGLSSTVNFSEFWKAKINSGRVILKSSSLNLDKIYCVLFCLRKIHGAWRQNAHMSQLFLNNLSYLTLETNDYTSCFLEIADWLGKTSKNNNSLKFFEKVAESMYGWIKFLDSKF